MLGAPIWFCKAVFALWTVLLLAFPARAEERYEVTGTRLIFNTEISVDGQDSDISYDDLEALRDILRAHQDVEVLELNSTGGGYYAAFDIADLVIDFALDTHVHDFCESSCVTIFLAGQKRTMARGGRIGFHQTTWTDASIERYYENNRERHRWEDPFDFAEWMYVDTQTEVYTYLSYLMARGVDAAFAIQTIRKPETSMWYPRRAMLQAAGVLRE